MPREGTKTVVGKTFETISRLRLDMPREGTKTVVIIPLINAKIY